MSLLTQYRASQDTDLRQRIAVALAAAAVDVMAEDDATEGHAARKAWALTVLPDAHGAAVRYAPAVMTNPSLAAQSADPSKISDSDLQFTVNSLVNALAGA